jgi:ATP-dependent exoDNAse (exonuclease V) alpha subunit
MAWDWRSRINDAIDQTMPNDPAHAEIEESARAEKASALEVLARARISALVGPAGTGKTTMLRALCTHPDVQAGGTLLLAPTGKARVQLAQSVKAEATVVAQFLSPDRFDMDHGYHPAPGAPRAHGFGTVVIDEASMLTEAMLAATIDGLGGVDRLILCGDPRQLPPIGAGRPFADLVSLLRESPGPGGGLAELTVGRRQLPRANATRHVRDDVAIASLFSIDAQLESAEEALGRAIAGGSDDTFRLVAWDDEEDLHRRLVEVLREEDLGLGDSSAQALLRSLGGAAEDGKTPRLRFGAGGEHAEAWQLLSPVRARPGGITALNQLVRSTWRAGDTLKAQERKYLAAPMGSGEVIFDDKVMCLRNDSRRAYVPSKDTRAPGRVANGEIGMVVWCASKSGGKPTGLKVEFSTQPDRQYTFWSSDLNGESSRGEFLEVAYAITVHKSQGSQFGTCFVVIPDPCPLLSPELLYTALTRQQRRIVVFKQGDLSSLRALADPSRSETARRLTCLFRPADPYTVGNGVVVDGSHVHRTARGELVRSKSEVIVANTLHALGIDYGYEVELRMTDGSWRSPDFTVRQSQEAPVYWEHLGMLDRPGYAADWAAKKQWYANHDIRPFDEGGGTKGVLVWSTENHSSGGIDAQAIDELARKVFGR